MPRRSHILIVDSNVGALARVRSALLAEALAEKVVTADSGESALMLIKQHPPHVILADMRLTDMAGPRLLLQAKGLHPRVITVLMADCGGPEAEKVCRASGLDLFLEKPFDVAVFAEKLAEIAGEEKSFFRGRLDDLRVPDVLQLIASRPVPMLIRLDSPHGQGAIEMENGEVIHARANGRVGEDAFYEISAWKSGFFEVVNVLCPEERTISASLSHLLITASQREEQQAAEARKVEALEAGVQGVGSFLPADKVAHEASYLWAPLAHYATPRVRASGSTRVEPDADARTARSRPEGSRAGSREAGRLRIVRASHPTTPMPYSPCLRPPVPRKRRTPRQAVMSHAKHLGVAAAVATLILAVGVRYADVFNGSYGRKVVPLLNTMKQGFAARRDASSDREVVRASRDFDLSQAIQVSDADVAQQLGEGGVRPSRGALQPTYRVGISGAEDLRSGTNRVGVDPALFDRLGLGINPWVEIVGPNGMRIGAYAVSMRGGGAPILITGSMAEVLLSEGGAMSHVQMRPIAWNAQPVRQGRDFSSIQRLPKSYCDYWFSIGLSLQAMQSLGLVPGDFAEVTGPDGYQSARVQLVDQGRPDEVWLGDNVRDSLGLRGAYGSIRIRPKS